MLLCEHCLDIIEINEKLSCKRCKYLILNIKKAKKFVVENPHDVYEQLLRIHQSRFDFEVVCKKKINSKQILAIDLETLINKIVQNTKGAVHKDILYHNAMSFETFNQTQKAKLGRMFLTILINLRFQPYNHLV